MRAGHERARFRAGMLGSKGFVMFLGLTLALRSLLTVPRHFCQVGFDWTSVRLGFTRRVVSNRGTIFFNSHIPHSSYSMFLSEPISSQSQELIVRPVCYVSSNSPTASDLQNAAIFIAAENYESKKYMCTMERTFHFEFKISKRVFEDIVQNVDYLSNFSSFLPFQFPGFPIRTFHKFLFIKSQCS